jgi:hypothetical protein
LPPATRRTPGKGGRRLQCNATLRRTLLSVTIGTRRGGRLTMVVSSHRYNDQTPRRTGELFVHYFSLGVGDQGRDTLNLAAIEFPFHAGDYTTRSAFGSDSFPGLSAADGNAARVPPL